MSVALIEPFDRLRNHPSTGSGTSRRNDCYTKYGGFDKLNHRNVNLLDSLFFAILNLFKRFKRSVIPDKESPAQPGENQKNSQNSENNKHSCIYRDDKKNCSGNKAYNYFDY